MTTTAALIGRRRSWRGALAVAGALALVAAACGDDDDDSDATATATDDLILGAPADCLDNAFCVPGLREVYDVDLEGNFTPLDSGSVVASLRSDAIDIGVLFSTDAVLADPDLVVLADDQGMFAADNILPIAAKELDDAYGDELAERVDAVTAALTTDGVTEMNSRYEIDNEDADVVAADWLQEQGLDDVAPGEHDGPEIIIGSQDFSESVVLAEVYGQALEASGFEVKAQSVGGFREILFGAFESGDINFAVDYLASELDTLAEESLATSDVDETLAQLEPLLADRDMLAYEPAAVVNTNVFVMTSDKADALGVESLSDLG